MAVGASQWVASAEAVAAAAAGTAKTVLAVRAATSRSVKVTEFSVGFAGASGTAKPVLVELCSLTFASNVPGTNSTSVTPASTDTGNADTVQATAGKAWTTEPTVVTVLKPFRVHPQAGLTIQCPLGREPRANNGAGIGLRVTFDSAETTTPIDAYLELEE